VLVFVTSRSLEWLAANAICVGLLKPTQVGVFVVVNTRMFAAESDVSTTTGTNGNTSRSTQYAWSIHCCFVRAATVVQHRQYD
jgi:hypothetical protein